MSAAGKECLLKSRQRLIKAQPEETTPMKNQNLSLLALALLALSTLNSQLSTAHAQGTAFTYQGRLNDGASVANGSYDLRFMLYSVVTGGSAIGSLTNT